MTENPLLLKGFTSGWIQKFFSDPFDPLCVMLAMRTKLLLDIIDEMGHSYNLLRSIGYGWIDFGDIPGETPGDPDSYYPPEINNPIIVTPPPTPAAPGVPPTPPLTPGQPGYGAPLPGQPGYTPPALLPGAPGYIPPPFAPGAAGALPGTPGAPGYIPPPAPPGAPGAPGAPAPGTVPPPIGGPGGLGGPTGSMAAPWGFGYGPGETGGRSGGGGGAAGIDCCLDKDDPSKNVHIGWDELDMDVGGSKNLTIGGADPLCGGDNYTWLFSPDQGSLDDTDPLAPIYTAPPGGPDCLPDQTIMLSCGGKVIETIGFTIRAAPASATIGYTTQQMTTDGEQTLTAVPGDPGCGLPDCVFSIKSGGGALGEPVGNEVVYTAPATNPNCDDNPTIALSCNGVELATLKIAVTSNVAGTAGYGGLGTCSTGRAGGACFATHFRTRFNCFGDALDPESCDYFTTAPTYCPIEEAEATWVILCGLSAATCPAEGDARTPEQKSAGCCPAQLL